jgi:uncharacterized DUF497 family protein
VPVAIASSLAGDARHWSERAIPDRAKAPSADDELRFNAIGLVDGRMLFVTYTMRGAVVRIISARGAEPHEKRKYHEL